MFEVIRKQVSKSALKPKMLEYFRQVEMSGETLIVTSHNVPVLKIEPIKKMQTIKDVFGEFWGKIHLTSEILEPESDEWEDV